MSGFLKISRRLFHHPIWREGREYSKAEAWLDMIQLARWKDGGEYVSGQFVDLLRGDLHGSLRWFQVRWKWGSTGKVKRFLSHLEDMGMIKVKDEKITNVITLVNYDQYNDHPKEEGQEATNPFTPPATPAHLQIEIVKDLGKNAAKIWTEGGCEALFGSKAEMVYDWLKYRREIERPLMSQAEMSELLKQVQTVTPQKLKGMMSYSIKGRYHALYPDYDKDKSNGRKGNQISDSHRAIVSGILSDKIEVEPPD